MQSIQLNHPSFGSKETRPGNIWAQADEKVYNCSLESLYAKKQYRRIIKRMTQDYGNIWYDNLELEIQDFKFIRDLYRTMFTHQGDGPKFLHKSVRDFESEKR
jgi:hypothetical protein